MFKCMSDKDKNNKIHEKRRKICDSWYHQWWFRMILIIVGIDMIVLGFSFAAGLDIISLTPNVPYFVRIIFGLMYIAVALFIIHYSLLYKKIKKESHFICHHCGHIDEDSSK